MKTLLELSRFYNQPETMELLTMTMPVLVEACRLDVAAASNEYIPTALTTYDVDQYLDNLRLVTPYDMRVMIAPEHGAVYYVREPAPLFGDALSQDPVMTVFFRQGIGMSYRRWALATWEDNADIVTVLAALQESPLTPVEFSLNAVESRTNACIITPDTCYIRIDPSKQ